MLILRNSDSGCGIVTWHAMTWPGPGDKEDIHAAYTMGRRIAVVCPVTIGPCVTTSLLIYFCTTVIHHKSYEQTTLSVPSFRQMTESDFLLARADLVLTQGHSLYSGPGSVVGIATGYGLDGPGIESRWGRDFPHLSRPALGPTQQWTQWAPGLSRG